MPSYEYDSFSFTGGVFFCMKLEWMRLVRLSLSLRFQAICNFLFEYLLTLCFATESKAAQFNMLLAPAAPSLA